MAFYNGVLFLLLSCISPASAVSNSASRASTLAEADLEMSPHPFQRVRHVLDLLEAILKKNRETDVLEEKLAEDNGCNCKKTIAAQRKIVQDLSDGIPELEAAIKTLTLQKGQIDAEKARLQGKIEEAQQSVEDAEALFKKEHGGAKKEISDYVTNIAAINKAVEQLRKGLGASFLQTRTADTLRNLIFMGSLAQVSDVDRDALGSFLAQGSSDQDDAAAPSTPEIIGILRQIADTMEKNRAEATAAYNKAFQEHKDFKEAKEKEIADLVAQISVQNQRIGPLLELLEQKKEALRVIKDGGYQREKDHLDYLIKTCSSSAKAFAARKAARAEEAQVITDVITILSRDEAREVFMKTLPRISSAMFLQLQMSKKQAVQEVRRTLESLPVEHHWRIDLIELALKGRKVDFGNVNEMIDKLLKDLDRQEFNEEKKRDSCIRDIARYTANIEGYKKLMEELGQEIETQTGNQKELEQSIKAKQAEIEGIAATLKQSQDDRSARREVYEKEKAENAHALGLLKMAKGRMAEYYDLLQVKDNANAEELAKDHTKVLALLTKLINDFENSMLRDDNDEKAADKMMEAAERKAAEDTAEKQRELDGLRESKADVDQMLAEKQNHLDTTETRDTQAKETLASLHESCDWLVQNYDERKKAREGEIESLKNAKAVLAGAVFDFLQEGRKQHRVQRTLRGSN